MNYKILAIILLVALIATFVPVLYFFNTEKIRWQAELIYDNEKLPEFTNKTEEAIFLFEISKKYEITATIFALLPVIAGVCAFAVSLFVLFIFKLWRQK